LVESEQGSDKAYELLPSRIDRIEVQKKNAYRYSIFVSGKFLIGVSEKVLVDCGLKKGQQITAALYDEIRKQEYRQQIRAYLLDLLSRRDHASRELLLKGRKKKYPVEILNDLIAEFEEKGFINNRGFAEKYCREKASSKNWGALKIKSELMTKGISAKDADAALKTVFEDVNTEDAILHLIQKRLPTLKRTDTVKRRDKIYRYLSGKGYKGEDIISAMPEIEKLIDLS
jgi:regulatory protein